MSLRIRRGTEAERIAAGALQPGELGYTTDTKRLYIGDGTTNGGNNVLATIAGTGLLWNATTQKLDFTGSGSGIISVSADPAPALGGNLTLSNHNIVGTGSINIAGTLNVSNGLSGNLNLGGNTIQGTGAINVTGTVTASALSSNVGAPTTVGYTINNPLTVGTSGTPVSLLVNSTSTNIVLTNTTDGTVPGGIVIKSSRGTLSSRTAVQAGDPLTIITGLGYDGADFQNIGLFGLLADPAGTVSSGSVPSAFGAITIDGSGNQNFLIFDSSGVLAVPTVSVGDGDAVHPSIAFGTDGGVDTGFFHPGDGILCITTNAVERVRVDSGGLRVTGFAKVGGFATGSLPSPAEAGMIVLDTTTNQFKGYNGSAWVVLG